MIFHRSINPTLDAEKIVRKTMSPPPHGVAPCIAFAASKSPVPGFRSQLHCDRDGELRACLTLPRRTGAGSSRNPWIGIRSFELVRDNSLISMSLSASGMSDEFFSDTS